MRRQGRHCCRPLKGHVEVAQLLLNANAGVGRLPNGTTPLHVAARHGNTRLVKMLLAKDAPVNMKDYAYGATPLHDACTSDCNYTSALDVRHVGCPRCRA